MAKFVMECPNCGRYAEAKTGFFARKKIDCACGHTINVKTEKLSTRTCPHCGNQMTFESIHALQGDEDFLDKTPYDIGIPLLHIIGGRVGMHTTYYEFTADAQEVFQGL